MIKFEGAEWIFFSNKWNSNYECVFLFCELKAINMSGIQSKKFLNIIWTTLFDAMMEKKRECTDERFFCKRLSENLTMYGQL